MDDSPQCDIARGLREGRLDAWNALYEAYSRRVWGAVARLMGDRPADVADVVQETFLAAARAARNYDPDRGSLWVWLWGIARRHVALHWRREGRQDRILVAAEGIAREHVLRWLENREESPPEALESAELAVQVRAALLEIPSDYGALLSARYLEGIAVEQLAAEGNLSLSAMRSKLARARRAFRQVFTETMNANEV